MRETLRLTHWGETLIIVSKMWELPSRKEAGNQQPGHDMVCRCRKEEYEWNLLLSISAN